MLICPLTVHGSYWTAHHVSKLSASISVTGVGVIGTSSCWFWVLMPSIHGDACLRLVRASNRVSVVTCDCWFRVLYSWWFMLDPSAFFTYPFGVFLVVSIQCHLFGFMWDYSWLLLNWMSTRPACKLFLSVCIVQGCILHSWHCRT